MFARKSLLIFAPVAAVEDLTTMEASPKSSKVKSPEVLSPNNHAVSKTH